MSFSTGKRTENGLELVVLKDDQEGTEALLLPAFGALLHGFSIEAGGERINVVDHYTGYEAAKKEISTSFKSARLSPFPCRIPEGRYSFEGKQYELQKKFPDGSAIHGLLYDKAFEPVAAGADHTRAMASFQYHYQQDDDQYPFDYTCTVEYILRGSASLEIRATSRNNGDKPIPMADGWHPYFQLGGKVDEWELYFDADAMLEFDDKLIPTGRLVRQNLFTEPRRIGPLFLDNCFLLNKARGKAACELLNPRNGLKVSFFPGEEYPYLQLFTPPHRKSIAIENLSAAPDSFNNRMGLLLLGPGQSQTFALRYQLSLR